MKKLPPLLCIFVLSIPSTMLLFDAILPLLYLLNTHRPPPSVPNDPRLSFLFLCCKIIAAIGASVRFHIYCRTQYPQLLGQPIGDRYAIAPTISIPATLMTALVTLPTATVWIFIAVVFIYGSLAYTLAIIGAYAWFLVWIAASIYRQKKQRVDAQKHSH